MDAYDAIITRTGITRTGSHRAGGDALARHVAPSGKRVRLPERGDGLLRERPPAPVMPHEHTTAGPVVSTRPLDFARGKLRAERRVLRPMYPRW